MQPRDQLLKLRHRAGAAQRNAAHMIVEIDVIVLDPYRFGEFEGHLRQFAAKYGSQMQALAKHGLHFFVVVALISLGELEHHQAADMHRRLRRFEMQERGVHATELIHPHRSFVVSRECVHPALKSFHPAAPARLTCWRSSSSYKSFFEIFPTAVFGNSGRISSACTISCLPSLSFRNA